jgi:hypothetical protein
MNAVMAECHSVRQKPSMVLRRLLLGYGFETGSAEQDRSGLVVGSSAMSSLRSSLGAGCKHLVA